MGLLGGPHSGSQLLAQVMISGVGDRALRRALHWVSSLLKVCARSRALSLSLTPPPPRPPIKVSGAGTAEANSAVNMDLDAEFLIFP